jgi:hypothetical protein
MTLKWGSTKKAVHAFRVSGGKVHCIKSLQVATIYIQRNKYNGV